MIQSPTSASRSGSVTSASTAARRWVSSSSNFRAACRHSSAHFSTRTCSRPCSRPCSSPSARPSATHSAFHFSLSLTSSITSSSRGSTSVGDQRASATGANGSAPVAHSTIPPPACVSRSGSATSASTAAERCAPAPWASATRANSSAFVPHSMIQSPTCASRSGSATSASTAARRRASSSNFRAACRHSSARSSARPCSSPSARPCSSPFARPSATHSAVHSCTFSDSIVSTSFSRGSDFGAGSPVTIHRGRPGPGARAAPCRQCYPLPWRIGGGVRPPGFQRRVAAGVTARAGPRLDSTPSSRPPASRRVPRPPRAAPRPRDDLRSWP